MPRCSVLLAVAKLKNMFAPFPFGNRTFSFTTNNEIPVFNTFSEIGACVIAIPSSIMI